MAPNQRRFEAEIRARLAGLDADPTRKNEIIDELTQHLELRYNELRSEGRPEPEAAAAVLAELPDRETVTRLLATTEKTFVEPPVIGEPRRRGALLDTLGQDLRYALRGLARSPGFTAVAVLTLALGIGANTSMFTVVNAVMLRPLPFPHAERLVSLYEENLARGGRFSFSHPNFLDQRDRNHTFENLAAFTDTTTTLTGHGDATVLGGSSVTATFLPTLGVAPALGRNFSADEDRPGGARVALVSHAFWQSRLGGRADALGETLVLDDEPWTVVGVLPADFRWGKSEVFWPRRPDPSRDRGDHRILVIGRLKPGVTVEQGLADLNDTSRQLAATYPQSNAGWTVAGEKLYDTVVPGDTQRALVLLVAAAGFVLLIACSNVANLFLARASARRREIAIRVALGARRGRIVAQLLVEALVLALIAGGAGVAIAYAVTAFLKSGAPSLPRIEQIALDGNVAGFAVAVSTATAILFGLVPALQASRANPNLALKDGGRGGVGGSKNRLRRALVVVEVALSVALLAGAGLLIHSFWTVRQQSPGFVPEHVLSFQLDLPDTRYATGADAWRFYQRVEAEVGPLPGVTDVAFTSIAPLSPGGKTGGDLEIPGRPAASDGSLPTCDWLIVSPGYFRALRIPLRGREFRPTDTREAPVTIISETLARRYWPGEDPIGKRVIIHSFGDVPSEIVGVAGDVKYTALDGAPNPMAYVSLGVHSNWRPISVIVRSHTEVTSAVLAAVARIDSNVPAAKLETGEEIVTRALGPRRFNTILLGSFAAVALALACVGLFGVMGYLVAQRRHEIGLRMALGARPRDIFGLIVGQGMLLALAGVAIGLLGAFWLTRALEKLLYEVKPTDPTAFVGAIVLLLAVTALACLIPARRAMRVDPMVALRSE